MAKHIPIEQLRATIEKSTENDNIPFVVTHNPRNQNIFSQRFKIKYPYKPRNVGTRHTDLPRL